MGSGRIDDEPKPVVKARRETVITHMSGLSCMGCDGTG